MSESNQEIIEMETSTSVYQQLKSWQEAIRNQGGIPNLTPISVDPENTEFYEMLVEGLKDAPETQRTAILEAFKENRLYIKDVGYPHFEDAINGEPLTVGYTLTYDEYRPAGEKDQ